VLCVGGRGRPRGTYSATGVGRGMSAPAQRLQMLAKKNRVVAPGQSCDECGKSFRYVACLERHKRIVHGSKQTSFETAAGSGWLNLDPELLLAASNMTQFQCTECPKVCQPHLLNVTDSLKMSLLSTTIVLHVLHSLDLSLVEMLTERRLIQLIVQ